MSSTASGRHGVAAATARSHFSLIFLGEQTFFFFLETAPHLLQRKRPGFALFSDLPLRHPISSISIAGCSVNCFGTLLPRDENRTASSWGSEAVVSITAARLGGNPRVSIRTPLRRRVE